MKLKSPTYSSSSLSLLLSRSSSCASLLNKLSSWTFSTSLPFGTGVIDSVLEFTYLELRRARSRSMLPSLSSMSCILRNVSPSFEILKGATSDGFLVYAG